MSRLEFACRHQFSGGFLLEAQFASEHRVTTLFGPSGSGKTSLLSMIAGFLAPQQARIVQHGRVLTDTARRVQLRPEQRQIGFVFQDHLLFPHLTVEANLRYGERRRQNGPRRIDFARVVAVLELSEILARSPRNLSGGERQRVGIGRALLSRPELLLLDEPLASLDESLRNRILSYIERIVHEWDIPILFVSHDQASVRRLAEWVVVLEKGKVTATGTPAEVLSRPELLGSQNGTGPVNLLRIENPVMRDGQVLGQVGSQTLHLPQQSQLPSGPIFVQFLPSEVMLSNHDIIGISARNHLRGTVRQLVDTPAGVFVAVDVGQILWAEVTQDAIRELDLHLGTEVFCLIKTTSLEYVA